MTPRLAVVVPTRNRADFAERAVRSVIDAAGSTAVALVVSDNSTDPKAARRLEAFCAAMSVQPGVQLHYLRADDLAMSEHWEWARIRTRELVEASHVTYLTDRSVLKPDAIATMVDIVDRFADDVLSYNDDLVDDAGEHVELRQPSWTGALVEVPSARLLDLSAQMVIVRALPRMLNSLVPVSVLDRVEAAYGSVFASAAPDFCFCYRALSLVPRILYLDRAVFTMYGTQRSNGASMASGRLSADSKDFLAKVGTSGGLPRDPGLPEVATTYAVIGGEHAAARLASTVVPRLNRSAYLRAVAAETERFPPGQLRDANEAALKAAGVRFGRAASAMRTAATPVHYLRTLGPRDFVVQSLDRLTGRTVRQVRGTEEGLALAADTSGHKRRGTLTLGYLSPTIVP